MSSVAKEFLVEHFLPSQSFQHTHQGEAFVVDESGQFLAALNLRDHLFLEVIDSHEDLESALNRLVKLEVAVGKSLKYAFSPRFGFLTADPGECGTGLLVSVYLHLPSIIHTGAFDALLDKYQDTSVGVTGLQGNPNQILGDIVVLHNNYTLGVTEENIISTMRIYATKWLVEEKSVRSLVKQEGKSEIKDKVSRAYAILLHSYQIEAVEALNALSLIKMGLDLEWLTGTTHTVLNALLFSIRRAHLLSNCGDQIDQEEMLHRRAEFIHKALKDVTLHI